MHIAYLVKNIYAIKGGVDRYKIELLEALSKKDIKITIISLTSSKSESLPFFLKPLKYELVSLASLKKLDDFDVVHIPDLYAAETPFLALRSIAKKLVITLHGVSPLVSLASLGTKIYSFYHKYRWNIFFKRGDNIGHIVTVSKSSKAEICKSLNIPSSRINVIYPGINTNKFHIMSREKVFDYLNNKYGIDTQYILSVTSGQPIKNLETVILGYYVLNRLYSKKLNFIPPLVIAGYVSNNVKSMIKKLGLSQKVVLTGFIKRRELVYLYNGAIFVVLASLREAFSLVPLESLACGAPLLLSDIPSYKEAIRDAAYYFEPKNYIEVAKGMIKLLYDDEQRKMLIKKGELLVKEYNWENAAKKYIELYYSISKV